MSLFSLLITIGFSVSFHSLEKQKAEQFFKVFHSDLLYLQQVTMLKEESYYLIFNESSHSYTIRKNGSASVLRARTFPSDWKLNLRTLADPLSFNFKGTIKTPGTFTMDTGFSVYKIVFPLGKGRSYIVEQ